jgi:hypothetical protein
MLSDVYWSPILPAPLLFINTFVDALVSADVSGLHPPAACTITLSPILTAPIPLIKTLGEHSLVDVPVGFAHLFPLPVLLNTESVPFPRAATGIIFLSKQDC